MDAVDTGEHTLLSFSTELLQNRKHARCTQELCVIQPEGIICITPEMREFLQSRNIVQHSQTDWETLLLCCQSPSKNLELLNLFSKTAIQNSEGYRLRFKYHCDVGIAFAKHLLSSSGGSIWGQSVPTAVYRNKIHNLIEQAPHGMEYRIFDLCDAGLYGIEHAVPQAGKHLGIPAFRNPKVEEQLALLFALGHGNNDFSPCTISELLARQQFFIEYFNELRKFNGYDRNRARSELSNSCQNVEERWRLYWNSAEEFSRQVCRINWSSADQFVAGLRNRMHSLHFSDRGSATYHPYKHRNVAFDFGCNKNASPQEVVSSYFHAIQQVVMRGQLTGKKPSQFSSGSVLSFTYSPDEVTYKLHISSQDNDHTFVLTCY